MDTTMGIMNLCDGDNNLVSPMIAEARQRVTIDTLRSEYAAFPWYEQSKKAVIACRDMFTPAIEEMTKAFMEMAKAFNVAFIKNIQEQEQAIIEGTRNREPIGLLTEYCRMNGNNYRKLHHMPMRREPRT
ncbi:MAG: hypothetical protein WA125_16635 [Desulfosporosinus sp.]